MSRLVVLAGLLMWSGTTIFLSEWRRFSRPSLVERLLPFTPGIASKERRQGVLSVDSLAGTLVPWIRNLGDRLASMFGITESVDLRLRRIHSPLLATEFRLRQFGWSGIGLLAALMVAALRPPLPATVLALVAAPLLGFLVVEQRLDSASRRWQESLTRELPVVAEQLAMLLNAGFSLGAALARLSLRGEGCCARDLRLVVNRIRQGLAEPRALREWADLAHVDALDRLVGILVLNSEASDLGRMISTEARQARRDLQRTTVGIIERRAQQVWIPVTVATLVPGAILLAIPFIAALRLFSSA